MFNLSSILRKYGMSPTVMLYDLNMGFSLAIELHLKVTSNTFSSSNILTPTGLVNKKLQKDTKG